MFAWAKTGKGDAADTGPQRRSSAQPYYHTHASSKQELLNLAPESCCVEWRERLPIRTKYNRLVASLTHNSHNSQSGTCPGYEPAMLRSEAVAGSAIRLRRQRTG